MRRVAYIMSRFPHLPETFILREMITLEGMGWRVLLYPLIFQKQRVIHPQARPWMQRAWRKPLFSADMLRANAQTVIQNPIQYAKVLGQVLWENRTSPKFLIRALILWPKIVTLARRLQSQNVRHIHAHYATHPALAAWIIHRLTGITYSVTVHAHDIFVEHVMLDTKLRSARFIAAISDFNRRYLADLLGEWVSPKTHVIHCGIDPLAYSDARPAWQVGERFEIIHTGSLQPYKGQRHLIEACAHLKARGVPFRCRLIGEGALRPSLQNLIHTLGLEEHVHLLGARTQDEVGALLAESHCYVQPSVITPSGKMEGIPVALMEAMASGLPAVATRISGIPELVRPRESGYLVPPEDSRALADALHHIYRHPQEAQQRARQGRALVLETFTLHANVKKLAALLQEAVE